MIDDADTTSRADQRSLEPLAGADTSMPLAARSDADETDETAEIRVEIEQTQADLAETINAIQEKLNPQTLAEQAKDSIRETATGMVEQAKQTVREATIGKAE